VRRKHRIGEQYRLIILEMDRQLVLGFDEGACFSRSSLRDIVFGF